MLNLSQLFFPKSLNTMKDIKTGCITILIWFFFSIISANLVNHLMGGGENLVYFVSLALPMLCVILCGFFFQAKEFVRLLFYIFTLPFQIFSKKKKTGTDDTQSTGEKIPASYGRSVIPLSMLIYGVAGWLIGPYNETEFWLKSYIFIGFCWGCILYLGLQKGVLDKEEMVS